MRRVILLMIALMFSLVALWGVVMATPEAGPATQGSQPQVNLWMSTDSQGPPMVSFPSATRVIYAVMEYSNLSNQSVRVTVIDDGKTILLDDEKRYTGSGQRVFPITGSSMLTAYQDDVETHGQNMTMKITEAEQYVRPGATVTETLSITPTVQAAVTEASSMRSGLQRVRERFPHSSETDDLLGLAISALDEVVTAGEEATEAGRTLEDMRARVDIMSTRGAEAVEYARKARYGDRAGRPYTIFLPLVVKNPPTGLASSFDIPETPSCRSNVSNLYIGSRLATTVEWMVGDPGPPHNVEVVASPSSIYAASVEVPNVPVTHTATIRATVTDAKCRPAPDVSVHFATNDPALGTVSPIVATTSAINTAQPGVAETSLTAGSEVGEGVIVVTATAGSAVGAEHVTLIGPAASLQVRVSRTYMATAGEANRIVVDVRDAHNWPVVDGTPVTFSVDPADLTAWSQETTVTHDGLASSYLNPLSATGRLTVTASVDGLQSEPVPVWIVGRAEDGEITITADPAVIYTVLPSAFSEITVNGWDGDVDGDGMPEPAPDGTQIRFETDDPSLGGFQDGDPSCGYCYVVSPLSKGVATARLFAKDGALGEAEISACLQGTTDCKFGGPFESTMVRFVGPPASITVTADPTSIPVGGSTSTIQASVTDGLGSSVADGTVVSFSTGLGTVDPVTTTTTSGVAVTTLTSGPDAGTATVTARSGSAEGTTSVTFTETSARARLPGLDQVVGLGRALVSRSVAALFGLTPSGTRVES